MYDMVVKCEQMSAALPGITQRLAAVHSLHEQGLYIETKGEIVLNCNIFLLQP